MKSLVDPKQILEKINAEYAFLQSHPSMTLPLWETHCRRLHNLLWFYVTNFKKDNI